MRYLYEEDYRVARPIPNRKIADFWVSALSE